jgi:DNA-binding NarL/FixJ family response regulator
VVEDDPLVRDFVVDTLEFSVNRKIHTFDNGFSAWQYIQASQPVHIFLRISMSPKSTALN